MAISSAGAWFGVKMNGWGWTESDALRRAAFLYGATLVAVGALFDRAGLKRHFTDVYFSFAAHLLQLAALSAVLARLPWTPVIFVLLALSTVAALYAARTRRWVYLIFAVVYSYIGVSAMIIRALADPGPVFLYLLLSAGGIAAAIVSLTRRSPDPS